MFLILLQWLLANLKTIPDPATTMSNMIIAYDNMCNLCRLKVAQRKLPFPEPFDQCWLAVQKIVDKFHHRNHIDATCKVKYSPDAVKEMHPTFNTQAAEQTFVWVARYKHILCAMSKVHHLFYLHRMVRRRNKYTEKCYAQGKKSFATIGQLI